MRLEVASASEVVTLSLGRVARESFHHQSQARQLSQKHFRPAQTKRISSTMTVIDPLSAALGQMNLHGVPTAPFPGSGTLNEAIEAVANDSKAPADAKKNEEQNDDELDDVEEELTYKPYRPVKLRYGKDHPDPVVENSTLAAVVPPDITYNLAMPACIISEGKLSNLQLEAVVYGCQRHQVDLPTAALDGNLMAKPAPTRAGFLLGDSAGMGKGRTLAGFVVENISRGRKKHVWISVSGDLYEDAKRDLKDLGLEKYASKKCYHLSKKFKSKQTIDHDEGVMFLTYSTLVSKGRFEQLLAWCGGDSPESFDGLILLDECHKCKGIELDTDGNPRKTSSQTAAKVVELQSLLPSARVVYCSATSVSEPKNLGFMTRLGLWGHGTEHNLFHQLLTTINDLGTGATELSAMHLKSIGALQARQLSYEPCNFEVIDTVSDESHRQVYDRASAIWIQLYDEILKTDKKKAQFWAEHLRFFQYMAIAAKVDTCIATAKQAIEDGYCCVVGLQSTGQASSQRAANAAGINPGDSFEAFVSAPSEGLMRTIRDIVPEDQVKKWAEEVNNLKLPISHLDRLLNELGGPSAVAELTGRTMRQVQRFDSAEGRMKVILERRTLSNLQEKDSFLEGSKNIAILSEAASTGISLQADKRVKNQRRRVHITLELPWSADKAIQQLGRTHRSNQSSGPCYKFIVSDVGGETRFASAVARRLNSLGALTQGDRRATGSANALGLGNFDIDNVHGNRALQKMLLTVRKCSKNETLDSRPSFDTFYSDALKVIDAYLLRSRSSSGHWSQGFIAFDDGAKPSDAAVRIIMYQRRALINLRLAAIGSGHIAPCVDEAAVTAAKKAGLNSNTVISLWLCDVDVNERDFPSQGKKNLVSKFLNRLLGLSLTKQHELTDYFLSFVEMETKSAKANGKYDVGITSLAGNCIEVTNVRSFRFEMENLQVFTIDVDQGMTFESALEIYRGERDDERNKVKNGFYMERNRRIEKVYLIINAGDKLMVVRPNVGKRVMTKQNIVRKIRYGVYEPCSEIEARDLWEKEFDLADILSTDQYQGGCPGRHMQRNVFAGSLIPVLKRMMSCVNCIDHDKQLFRVVRVETSKPSKVAPEEAVVDAQYDSPTELEELALDTVTIDAGQGIALAMKDIGSSILRGHLRKQNEEGKWIVKFTNGFKVKMNNNQAKTARQLFQKEVASLVSVNMPLADASSLSETAAAPDLTAKPSQPVLGDGDDISDKYELLFEERFQGEMPETLVGIEFSETRIIDENFCDDLVVWESVLRDLAKMLLLDGVEPVVKVNNIKMDALPKKED